MNTVFHFAKKQDLDETNKRGFYSCESLLSEGFIHFSFKEQVEATGKKHCAGIKDLFLLEIKVEGLEDLRVENGFPHLYSVMPLENILGSKPIEF